MIISVPVRNKRKSGKSYIGPHLGKIACSYIVVDRSVETVSSLRELVRDLYLLKGYFKESGKGECVIGGGFRTRA